MVEIGGRPILWHIMKIYEHYGFKEFIICLGYKGGVIKDYFLNYEMMNSDLTIRLNDRKSMQFHNNHAEEDWSVTLADTGEKAQTGARVKRIEKYIHEDSFMLTYGDGVININIKDLIKYHESHKKIGTVTGVHPSSRFGELMYENNQVIKFSEKPQVTEGLINGGYFVFNRKFFDYLDDDDDCVLEREPLEALAADGELMMYAHHGFWQCVDTHRELELVNNMWQLPSPPWKVWK